MSHREAINEQLLSNQIDDVVNRAERSRLSYNQQTDEFRQLNHDLQAYLGDIRTIDDENRQKIDNIEHLRNEYVSTIENLLKKLPADFHVNSILLNDAVLDRYRHKSKAKRLQMEKDELKQRIGFLLQNEKDQHKVLTNLGKQERFVKQEFSKLNEQMKSLLIYVENEKQQNRQAMEKLDNLLIQLEKSSIDKAKTQYEIQTLKEEVKLMQTTREFLNEERDNIITIQTDANEFMLSRLNDSILRIREDFNVLNQLQLKQLENEYKQMLRIVEVSVNDTLDDGSTASATVLHQRRQAKFEELHEEASLTQQELSTLSDYNQTLVDKVNQMETSLLKIQNERLQSLQEKDLEVERNKNELQQLYEKLNNLAEYDRNLKFELTLYRGVLESEYRRRQQPVPPLPQQQTTLTRTRVGFGTTESETTPPLLLRSSSISSKTTTLSPTIGDKSPWSTLHSSTSNNQQTPIEVESSRISTSSSLGDENQTTQEKEQSPLDTQGAVNDLEADLKVLEKTINDAYEQQTKKSPIASSSKSSTSTIDDQDGTEEQNIDTESFRDQKMESYLTSSKTEQNLESPVKTETINDYKFSPIAKENDPLTIRDIVQNKTSPPSSPKPKNEQSEGKEENVKSYSVDMRTSYNQEQERSTPQSPPETPTDDKEQFSSSKSEDLSKTASSNEQKQQQIESSVPQSPNNEKQLIFSGSDDAPSKTIVSNESLIKKNEQQSLTSSEQQANTSARNSREDVFTSGKEDHNPYKVQQSSDTNTSTTGIFQSISTSQHESTNIDDTISDVSQTSTSNTRERHSSSPHRNYSYRDRLTVDNDSMDSMEIDADKQKEDMPKTSSMDDKQSDNNKSEADLLMTSALFEKPQYNDEKFNMLNVNEEKGNFSSVSHFDHQVAPVIGTTDQIEKTVKSAHFPPQSIQSESNSNELDSFGYQREEKHYTEEEGAQRSSSLGDSLEDVSKSWLDTSQTVQHTNDLQHSTDDEYDSQQKRSNRSSDDTELNENQQIMKKLSSQSPPKHQLLESSEEKTDVNDEDNIGLTLEAIRNIFRDLTNDDNIVEINDELPKRLLSRLKMRNHLLQTLFEGVLVKYIAEAASDRERPDTLNWNEFRDILFPILTGHYMDRHVRKLFELFDTSKDGYLSKGEIGDLLRLMQIDNPNSTANNIIQQFDGDNDGYLSVDGN
ncbi:unnamed protein product, partial [Didymodactylos carnosus]